MNNNVFNCPICWLKYNKTIRLPITLSCGHVICKLCINSLMINTNTLICSLDKTTISVDPKNFPICYTIMDHMPEDNPSEFVCKNHPNKRIKYTCSNDNENLCSKCMQKHKKCQHNLINFRPKKASIEDEINLIKKHIEEKQISISIQNKKYSEIKQKLIENLKIQLETLDSEANFFINLIKKGKENVEEQIKIFCKTQFDGIDETKKSFNLSLSTLNQMLSSTMKISQMLETKNNLIYDDVLEEKKKVIQEWEIFIKNFKLPVNSYQIPLTKVEKRKLNQLESELFSFTTVKFSDIQNPLISTQTSTIQTPCDSNSKNFFINSNFSTNATITNQSKQVSNRKYYSPEQKDSKIISQNNFQSSPKILNTHYSGVNINNYNSNGSSNFNILGGVNNTNSNSNNNQNQIICSNSKNHSGNFSNMILNTNSNTNCQFSPTSININTNSSGNILKTSKNESKEKDAHEFGRKKETTKRSNSSIVKKFGNKQIIINFNSNTIANPNQKSIPMTTHSKNQNKINFNANIANTSNKPIIPTVEKFEDSNDSIRDIIKNLNDEKINLNFNKKLERPAPFKINEKIKKKDSGNVPVKIDHNKIEIGKMEMGNPENSKLNNSF